MKKQEATQVINGFLESRGIPCPMASEDQRTYFWSYRIPEHRQFGWISLQDDSSTLLASITFGILKPPFSNKVLTTLLELNSCFTSGLSYATEMESLVIIRFSSDLDQMLAHHLRTQLKNLHRQAQLSAEKFISPDFQIEHLPNHWFESGGFA